MDLSLVTGAVGALRTALDIGKAAVEIRDANKLNEVVIRMNEQLLNAQQSLFAHNAELLNLQQEHFKATQELRELNEALSERRRYTLFELGTGKFVYRAAGRPVLDERDGEIISEPEHYICQPCFDGPAKAKIILRGSYAADLGRPREIWHCPHCKTGITVYKS
ncbi:hypothetical protein [Achromobacter insuavis]|uniref:hypothetical protein n=1 Tax=Achromobacter insuavis TaxID=1287735 RepID=UPI001F139215|nr:hypothetical protein [Achromobacter insuavis]